MKNKLFLLLAVLAAIALLCFGATVLFGRNEPTVPEAETSNDYSYSEKSNEEASNFATNIGSTVSEVTELTGNVVKSSENGGEYKYAYAGFSPSYADVKNTQWNLILVNRDYILPDDYSVKLAPAVESMPDGERLDYRVAPHYNEMYLAAQKDGIDLEPVSGYRSVERQTRNFERKINYYMDEGMDKIEATQTAATHILPPGTSEHNAGLAMDICSLYQNFDQSEEFEWLCENAADYGFILRYPKDKEDVTEIIYEPWHWRYVGVETAKKIKASGLCYEEYLGLV